MQNKNKKNNIIVYKIEKKQKLFLSHNREQRLKVLRCTKKIINIYLRMCNWYLAQSSLKSYRIFKKKYKKITEYKKNK